MDDYSPPLGEFQPPDPFEPERDGDDVVYGALIDLDSIDRSVSLLGSDKAFNVVDRVMTLAYAEGRKDEREEWLPVLEALKECADRLAIHMKHTEDLVAHMRACKAIASVEGKS